MHNAQDENAPEGTVQTAVVAEPQPNTMPAPPNPAANAMPTKIGAYRILEEIGRGAMGAVYRAEHENLGRVVALKILPPEMAHDAGRLDRFQREMSAIGRLDHENIVLATDAGLADGYFFIAMQFVKGMDLDQVLKRVGRLNPEAACDVIRQAALGLQHIHENNLVHRDIKPPNLIISADGAVKILDLGIARLRLDGEDQSAMTAADALMGTPDFIAPEQIRQCRDVDIRADIYSLGCTLYKLLSGHVPFEGDEYGNHTAKLVGHANHEPTPLVHWCPDLHEGLVAIVDGMMAKSVDDRPQTPAEVVRLLETFANDTNLSTFVEGTAPVLEVPAASTSIGNWTPTKKQTVLSPQLAIGLATGVVALLGAAALFLPNLIASSSATEANTLQIEAHTAETANNTAATAAATEKLVELQRQGNDAASKIEASTDKIEDNTTRIAETLESLRDRFAAFETSASAIGVPNSPGDFYHNARVYSEKGDYRKARQSFLQYFRSDLDAVDPHLEFVQFLKLQEGLAGAREVYASLPGDRTLVSRRFATALLQNPEIRKQQLQAITDEFPKFAPAWYELSREHSAARLGQQTLTDKRAEKTLLKQFLKLHDEGNLVRHYLDKSSAIEQITEAESRVKQGQWLAESVLENPVKFNVIPLGSDNKFMISLQIMEAATEVFYRIGDDGEFKSTGTSPYGIDPRTGKAPPVYTFNLQAHRPTSLHVKYVDGSGQTQGPFTEQFSPSQRLLDQAMLNLKSKPENWVRLHNDGSLYFDVLMNWRALKEVRYGIGQDVPNLVRRVPAADMNDANSEMYHGIDVSPQTPYISMQITYIDGTKSEVVKIKRLSR